MTLLYVTAKIQRMIVPFLYRKIMLQKKIVPIRFRNSICISVQSEVWKAIIPSQLMSSLITGSHQTMPCFSLFVVRDGDDSQDGARAVRSKSVG